MVADLDGDKKPEIVFLTLAGDLVVLDEHVLQLDRQVEPQSVLLFRQV
jgi:hypothetical protein